MKLKQIIYGFAIKSKLLRWKYIWQAWVFFICVSVNRLSSVLYLLGVAHFVPHWSLANHLSAIAHLSQSLTSFTFVSFCDFGVLAAIFQSTHFKSGKVWVLEKGNGWKRETEKKKKRWNRWNSSTKWCPKKVRSGISIQLHKGIIIIIIIGNLQSALRISKHFTT